MRSWYAKKLPPTHPWQKNIQNNNKMERDAGSLKTKLTSTKKSNQLFRGGGWANFGILPRRATARGSRWVSCRRRSPPMVSWEALAANKH